jgi:hypothetical protein
MAASLELSFLQPLSTSAILNERIAKSAVQFPHDPPRGTQASRAAWRL